MAKKQAYFAEAERLYVVEQLTLAEIASRLKVCERTLITWKAEGDWETRKKQLLAQKQSFHEELYVFARKLMKSISEDMDKGEKPDAGRMYTFSRLLPGLTKVKEYEDKVDSDKPKEKALDPEEAVRIVQKALLGE